MNPTAVIVEVIKNCNDPEVLSRFGQVLLAGKQPILAKAALEKAAKADYFPAVLLLLQAHVNRVFNETDHQRVLACDELLEQAESFENIGQYDTKVLNSVAIFYRTHNPIKALLCCEKCGCSDWNLKSALYKKVDGMSLKQLTPFADDCYKLGLFLLDQEKSQDFRLVEKMLAAATQAGTHRGEAALTLGDFYSSAHKMNEMYADFAEECYALAARYGCPDILTCLR